MPCEFLSGLLKLPFATSDVAIRSGSLDAGVIYLFISARNRAGWTIASDPVLVTIAANTGIRVTLPIAARGIGTNFIRYSLAANATSDPIQSRQIAEWETYYPDGVTPRIFDPIELFLPAHIALAPTIATPADLPTGSELINGMHRLISGGLPGNALASYYKYSAYESRPATTDRIIVSPAGDKWVRVLSPYTGQFVDPYGVGGCAADVRSIDPNYISLPPDYNPNQPNPIKGVPIALTWRNDSTLPLKAGTNFGLEFRQGAENRTDAFNGKAIVTLKGYTDGNGGLDKIDASGGANLLPFVDVDRVWSYSEDALGILTLDKDLPPDRSVVYEIAPYFTAQQFNGNLASGELISIYLYPYSQSGQNVRALAALTGDLVLPVGDRLRVLPRIGAGVDVGGGSAIVKNYVFSEVGEQSIFGLALNTPNQQIVLDGNGVASLRQTPLGSEAILAIVSTQATIGRIGVNSPPVSIVANGSATLNLTYSGLVAGRMEIRSGYPSIGGIIADFNPPFVDIYAVRNGAVFPALSSGTNRFSAGVGSVVINAIGNAILSPPVNSVDPLVDLFSPPTINPVAGTGGTIAAGSYQFFAVYYYDGSTVSKIDRSNSAVIRESSLSLADLYLLNQGWGRPVYELTDLRELPSTDTFAYQYRPVGRSIFYYDPESLSVDNGATVFKPSYLLASSPGRWIKRVESGGGGSIEWTNVSGGGNYPVPAIGGRFSINNSAGATTLVLPPNPPPNTEVAYQIIDNGVNQLSVKSSAPNLIDYQIGLVRAYHNPLSRRFDLEILRFVNNNWLSAYGKLAYQLAPAIPIVSRIRFRITVVFTPNPTFVAPAQIVLSATLVVLPTQTVSIAVTNPSVSEF